MTASATLGFVFPGQGSQHVGMLAELAVQHPLITETFTQASQILDQDLWALCQQGSEEELGRTEVTQPLLLTASVALWRLWRQLDGPSPAVLAGHSLGEWSALVCAGAIEFADALRLVRQRGRYMQAAVPVGTGAMLAVIGLDDSAVAEACAGAAGQDRGLVGPVNFNAPGQVVIAGHVKAVERAAENCKRAGAKRTVPLPVSAPFHTALMHPAADKLEQDMAATEFTAPAIPVIHNASLESETDPAAIKKLLIRQITEPVPWVATVRKLAEMGAQQLCECGPGRVLSGLNRRIAPDISCLNTATPPLLETALQQAAQPPAH
ncbi:MAG: ACP S-malonyltransferase [Cellvibrionales bacterium]|nr:ACP S-malonyltransferase [Cellvibrionales bacterium]